MDYSVDSRIAGKTYSSPTITTYVGYDHSSTTPEFIRNPEQWAADLDFSGNSPWNSYTNGLRGGTLISPRHVVFANHYTPPNGTTLKFVTSTSTVFVRTLTNSLQVPGTDIQIGILDSDVPEGINFYPIMSSTSLAQYLDTNAVPFVVMDQDRHAFIQETSDAMSGASTIVHDIASTTPDRINFTEPVISGDSGEPSFFLIGSQLVLALAHYTSFMGNSDGYYENQINTVMDTLGGGISCF